MDSDIDSVRTTPYIALDRRREPIMPRIEEVATMTAKGQVTVPKTIRDALGADLNDAFRDKLLIGQ